MLGNGLLEAFSQCIIFNGLWEYFVSVVLKSCNVTVELATVYGLY